MSKFKSKLATSYSSRFSPNGGGLTSSRRIIDIPNLKAWYDFSNSTYLTRVGAAITQALDRSGNANHTAIQGTGASRPQWTDTLNGLTVSTWDGGDTLVLPSALYSITNGNNTMFVVSKRATSAPAVNERQVAFASGGADRAYIQYNTGAAQACYINRGVAATTPNVALTTTDYAILTGFKSGTTQSIAAQGGTASTDTNGTNFTSTSAAIGSSNTGGIAEILIYSRALTTVEILQIELYLANKYGIYHPSASWINSYGTMQRAIIHALKLNKDDVGTNTTGNTVAAYYDPSRQVTGSTTSLTDYGRSVNTATEATNPPVNTANGISGQNALLFNGTTTILNAGTDTSIDDIFAAGGTIIAVIKPTTSGEADVGRIVDKAQMALYTHDSLGSATRLRFGCNFSIANGDWETTSRDVTLGAANIVAITYNCAADTNNPTLYVNSLTAKAITESVSPSGTAVSDAANSLRIGNVAASSATFDGYIGEIFAIKQILSASQLSTIITPLATKWGIILT